MPSDYLIYYRDSIYPTCMQNIRPLKIADTVNVPVFLNAKKGCDDVNFKFWGFHLLICSLGKFAIFYDTAGFLYVIFLEREQHNENLLLC